VKPYYLTTPLNANIREQYYESNAVSYKNTYVFIELDLFFLFVAAPKSKPGKVISKHGFGFF
jgi:hypothetical protein